MRGTNKLARLPTKEELGKPVDLSPRGGIAQIRTPDASGIGISQGIANLGKGISSAAASIQAGLKAKKDQDSAIDAVRADAQAKIRKMELARELEDNEQDYSTWGPGFEERAKKIDEEAAALIRDPVLREKFSIHAMVDTASGKDRLLGKANERDRLEKQVAVIDALDKHRLIYLDAKADDKTKTQALADIDAAVAVAVQKGLLTLNQAATLKKRYADGSIKEDAAINLLRDPDALAEDLQGKGTFRRRLEQRESGGDPTVVNKIGYAGSYQFGAPRLMALGFYRPGQGEQAADGKWGGKKWTGEFNIPSFPQVRTLQDFLANPQAQDAAFDAHVALMDQEIAKNGLDKYEGTTVGGVQITRDGLYAMLHLGGVKSTKRALASSGADNPEDDNGTSVLEYAAMGAPYNRYAKLDPVDRAEIEAKIAEEKAKRLKVGSPFEAQAQLANPSKVWDPTDSDDKKRMDVLFSEDGGAAKLMGGDQPFLDDAVMPLVELTGMIPRDVKGAFTAMTRSSDVGKVTFALSSMDKLEQLNPQAFARDMGEDALKKVVRYREQLAYRKPEEIVEELRRSEDPSRVAARKTMLEVGRKEAANVSDGDIADHFDLGLFYAQPDMPSDPLTSAELRSEFDRLFTEEYAVTGNTEAAKSSALKLLGAVWGTTDVTGERQLMRHPPEKFYAVNGLDNAWMGEQAASDLTPYLKDGSSFTIRPDAQTEAEISRGVKPSYLVIVKDEYGIHQALINEQTGKLIRMNFDAKPFIDKRQQEKEKGRDEFAVEHKTAVGVKNTTQGLAY
jgi:hypothetical protein